MSYFKRQKLENSNLVIQWWRKGFIWMLIILGVTFSACDGDSDLESISSDDYYVKYIVKSQTIYSTSKIAEVKMENNSNEDFTFNNGNWEMTIGPVKKGFNASCDARHDTSQNLARTYIDVEIHVSKNNGPFALKAIDNSTEVRMHASTSYTID